MPRKRVTPLSKAVDQQLYIVGKSRSDLAAEIGITYQYLSNILTGRQPLSISMSKRIGSRIDVNSEVLRRLSIHEEFTA